MKACVEWLHYTLLTSISLLCLSILPALPIPHRCDDCSLTLTLCGIDLYLSMSTYRPSFKVSLSASALVK
jgi:hypothetical protein